MPERFTFQMEPHGSGGFAKVVKGRDNTLERNIAVKVLDPLVKAFQETLLYGIILMLFFSPATRAADGTPIWTNYFNGSIGDTATAIGLDSNGNVVVTGYIHNSSGDIGYGTVKYSSAGVPLWTNLFNRFKGFESNAKGLAVDSSGNVYVTGNSSAPSSGDDYATIKYSGAGVPLWTNIYNGAGNGNDFATPVAVDDNGNVFVTGYATGIGSGVDYATIKYSSTGVPLWTNIFNGAGNGNDSATSLALDSGGNVIVTGRATGSGSGYDYATIKYSGAGVPLWTNIYNGDGNGNDFAKAVAVDDNGNVFVTGYATGIGSGFDYATIKYSSAGVPLWTNIFNGAGNGNDSATSLALDSGGNVIVTGTAVGRGSGYDYATIKYSSAGMPLWTNIFNGAGNSSDIAAGLALDESGNVYVTGYSTLIGGRYVYATIKYSNAGVPIWTNLFDLGGNNFSRAYALAVDGTGNVYVTGHSGNTYQNFSTIKYSGPAPANSTPLSFITTNSNFGFTNNQFSILLTGPAGSNAVISASTNLQIWVPLLTNPLTGGTLAFTDALATNFTRRFYRAALQ